VLYVDNPETLRQCFSSTLIFKLLSVIYPSEVMKFALSHFDRDLHNVFQNVTKTSLIKGTAFLTVLTAAVALELSQQGTFGFVLTRIPLWCFGLLASAGGVLFFLGPMLFGTVPTQSLPATKTGERLFLYLRPFELDARSFVQLMVGASTGVVVYMGLLKGLWWPLTFVPLIINVNKEQNFQEVFRSFGRFITFGKPHEWLQPIGASRVYAQDDWKGEVTHFMSLARLVIIRPGESKSIRWEIEQVRNLVPPDRIVFYLQFRGWRKRKERAYQSFRSHLQSQFPTKLPKQLGRARFLIFDHSWHPHFVEEANRPSQLVHQLFSRSGDITRDNLRPLLKALDLSLPNQPNNLANNLTTVGLWLAALFSSGLVFVSVSIATIRIIAAISQFFLKQG